MDKQKHETGIYILNFLSKRPIMKENELIYLQYIFFNLGTDVLQSVGT